jgi:hypothetical protein
MNLQNSLSRGQRALLVLSCSGHPVGLCRRCDRPLWLSDLFADIQSYRRTYFCPQCGNDVTEALHEHVDTCAFVTQSLSGRAEPVSTALTNGDAAREVAHDSRVIMQCLATHGGRDKAKTTRMAVAFAASAVVTVILALPLVSSIAYLVRAQEGDARAVADSTGLSNGHSLLEPLPQSVRSLMTSPPAHRPPALPEGLLATRTASGTKAEQLHRPPPGSGSRATAERPSGAPGTDDPGTRPGTVGQEGAVTPQASGSRAPAEEARDEMQVAEGRPRRVEPARVSIAPPPTHPTIASTGPTNEGPRNEQAAAPARETRPTTAQAECSLKSRITGDLRKAFSLCPDERRHIERVERFFDDVGGIAERGTTEVVSSIKRAASLAANERARLEKLKRFVEGLPDAPVPTDDRFQGK